MTDRMSMERKKKEFHPVAKENFWPMLKSEWLQWRLNKTPIWNIPMRNWLIRHLLGSIDGTPFAIQNPFHISFGNRTHVGKNFFANNGCIIYDHGGVRIGDNVMLGPNVIITTVSHPMLGKNRSFCSSQNSFEPQKRDDIELVAPITIGNQVWIAAGCVICPGVEIGDNTVIGAGSIVTRVIPANVFAYGAPCKTIKKLDDGYEDELVPEVLNKQ